MSGDTTIVACGCGTAGYWTARSLVRSSVVDRRVRLVLCDRADVRPTNAVTCPGYTTPGQPKCLRLAELARRWSGADITVEALQICVEQLPWDRILRGAEAPAGAFAVVGLDNWPSRLAVAEDLRAAGPGPNVLMVQIGLDRGQASIAVFGSRFSDPCPACGLPSLPDAEPCVAFTSRRELLRGNLRAEAQAAARVVGRIIHACLAPAAAARWINTKTNLVLTKPRPQRVEAVTRPCRKAAGCLGPHGPASSIRWSELLHPVTDSLGT